MIDFIIDDPERLRQILVPKLMAHLYTSEYTFFKFKHKLDIQILKIYKAGSYFQIEQTNESTALNMKGLGHDHDVHYVTVIMILQFMELQ